MKYIETYNIILDFFLEKFKLDKNYFEEYSETRKFEIIIIKYCTIYVLKKLFNFSCLAICKLMKYNSHASILHAYESIENMIQINYKYNGILIKDIVNDAFEKFGQYKNTLLDKNKNIEDILNNIYHNIDELKQNLDILKSILNKKEIEIKNYNLLNF